MFKVSKTGYLVATTILVFAIGISIFAATQPTTTATAGVHIMPVYNTTSQDSGVGLFRFDPNYIASGIYLRNGKQEDTILSIVGNGTPRVMYGTSSSGIATVNALTSDTAGYVAISTTFSDANNSNGTWTSGYTNGNGSCTSTFLTEAAMSTGINFGETGALSTAFKQGFDTYWTPTQLAADIHLSGFDRASDSSRCIISNSNNQIIAESQVSVIDSFVHVTLDTGSYAVTFISWDASQSKYKIQTRKCAVGGSNLTVANESAIVKVDSGLVGAITGCTVIIDTQLAPSNTIALVKITDVLGDSGPGADNFVQVDSNSVVFDTRMPFTVFQIQLFDSTGRQIKTLPSGYLTVQVKYNNFPDIFGSLKLMHRNETMNKWEIPYQVGVDSAAQLITARLSEFSLFGVGSVSSPNVLSKDLRDCVIDATVGSTPFASVMPTLRGMRDVMLTTSIGRFLVSGYYGFAALMLLAAAGLGISKIRG